MGYIYKITNIVTKKLYIGSTIQHNYENRWRKHRNCINYKEGCSVLKASMIKHGLENFKFEILIICFDDDLFKYEREYIKKYNCQIPNGYNILSGGRDGFLGYKHTPETIEKIKKSCNRFWKENPNFFKTYSEKLKESMKKVNMSECVKNSVKFQTALKEKRVGGANHKENKLSEDTKKKISEGVKKYYSQNENNKLNIENHRESMARAVGKPVTQYTRDGVFIKEYKSIAEAGRTYTVTKNNIGLVLSGRNKTAGGFIWKYSQNISEGS